MSLINLIAASSGNTGGGSITLSAPASVSAAAGDSVIRVSCPAVTNATNYRFQISSDNFSTVTSVTVDTNVGLVAAANGTACKYRAQALRVGSTPSAFTTSSGTVTPASAARLATPVISSVIATDGGITIKTSKVSGQERTLYELSTSKFFFTIDGQLESDADVVNMPSTNGTAYFVRISGKADLIRSSYTAMSQKTVYKGYNTFTPHTVSSTKLSVPIISQYKINSGTSITIELLEGDLRDENYTAELHGSTAFSSALLTVTNTVNAITFTGMTAGVPYRLRLRSNKTGLTSSDWAIFPDVVLSGVNVGVAYSVADGDSNTAGQPYASAGNNYLQLAGALVDPAIFGAANATVLINHGVGGAGILNPFGANEQGSFLNYAGYSGARTRNIITEAFGTNDITVVGNSLDQYVTNTQTASGIRNKEGFKSVWITPGVPYSDSNSWGAGLKDRFHGMSEYIKGNYKSLLGGFVATSLYDDEYLFMATTETASYWDGGVGAVHYTDAGYARIADRYYRMLNAIGAMIFAKAAAVTSLSWNSGTQNATIVLPSGYEAADCEITLDWDGGVGVNSTWVDLTSLTKHITTTQAIGSVAVRVRQTRSTQPSDVVTNSIQYN